MGSRFYYSMGRTGCLGEEGGIGWESSGRKPSVEERRKQEEERRGMFVDRRASVRRALRGREQARWLRMLCKAIRKMILAGHSHRRAHTTPRPGQAHEAFRTRDIRISFCTQAGWNWK